MTPGRQNGQLTLMSELSNFRIKPEHPDPRGWTVVGPMGRIGHVIDLLVDTQAMRVRKFLVYAGHYGKGDGFLLTIDTATVDVRENAQQIFARSRGERYSGSYANHPFTFDGSEGHHTRTEVEQRSGKREELQEDMIGKHDPIRRCS